MYKSYRQPAFTVATTKLQHDWSANRCVPHINTEWLDELVQDPRFGEINSMVKIRLLLAGLLALDQAPTASAAAAGGLLQSGLPDAGRAGLQDALQELRKAVGADADEWNKVMAAAAGPMDGRLDLEAVMQQSAAVHESMTGLKQQASTSNQLLLPPLEDMFLQGPPSVLDPDAEHFVVRPNARVQPLSAGFSYTQATPPPPSLFRTQGARATTSNAAGAAGSHGAAGPKPAQQQQQQAAGAAGSLSRSKSRQLDRQHNVVVLGKDEQADLFKNTQYKHGVASAVRQELLTSEKPDKPPSKQPRQLEQQQQLRDAFHQQEQPKGRRFNIFHNTVATAPAAAAQEPPDPALDDARRRPIDDELDDLFDDGELSQGPEEEEEPEWDFSYRRSAATAASKSVGGHLHRKHTLGLQEGPEEHEGTPEDLMDDMEGDAGVQDMQEGQHGVQEDEDQTELAAGSSGAGPAAQEGGVEEPHAVAAKRRRMHVIASDSEDDD